MGKKTATIKDAREWATRCLGEVERSRLLAPEAFAKLPSALSPRDRDFAHEIVYGTFRYLPGLERLLARFCKPAKTPPPIRWLLLASLYQLRFTRAKPFAVLDEANKLAAKLGFPALKGLVNGVLRNVLRQASQPWSDEEAAAAVAPLWLATLLRSHYGEERLRQWTALWRDRAPIAYWAMDDRGLDEDPRSDLLPHAFHRTGPIAPARLVEGRVYVQNDASQAVAEIACRARPETLLDLCAAPGGKCCYIARFGGVRQLTAVDAAPERMFLLKQNQERLGLSFETRAAPAETLDLPPASQDFVLVDAPCSGIGIVARHPEIKFLRKGPADAAARRTQAEILRHGWRFVKPGGYLLYTVCSLDPDERPEPPADALPAEAELTQWLPAGAPFETAAGRFHTAPDPHFDGFLGMLLRKPPA